MIGKDDIAEAIRNADALAGEHDLPAYWQELGVDLVGLSYVAMQRGLRAVMYLRDENPNLTEATPVALNEAEHEQQIAYAAMFMEGFAAAMQVRRKES